MELYITLCYSIKDGNIGLLKYTMREICIIFQALAAPKPKYAYKMLRQVYMFNTKAADPILQEAYLTNALINLQSLGYTFYETNHLLEHQTENSKGFEIIMDCRSRSLMGCFGYMRF